MACVSLALFTDIPIIGRDHWSYTSSFRKCVQSSSSSYKPSYIFHDTPRFLTGIFHITQSYLHSHNCNSVFHYYLIDTFFSLYFIVQTGEEKL